MNDILIYTPNLNSRISYIFDLIFNQILGLSKVEFTNDLYAFTQSSNIAKINYSNSYISNIPYFSPHPFLKQTGIRNDLRPQFKKHGQLIAAFYNDFNSRNQKSLLPFDPFALAFYLVSRYEEYQLFTPDQHGRFSATSSVAYMNRFLQQPLVNLWALELKKLLLQYYPALNFVASTYKYTPTYDIDHAYAFLNKGIFRQTGAFINNIMQSKWESLQLQLKTWFRLKKDPFYTFDYLQQLDQKFKLHPIYFWLLGDHGTYDKNIHPENPRFQQLIQHNAQLYPIGIHPSFGSSVHQDIVDKEIHRLEKITQGRIMRSRQHFLILRFPDTYQRLINLGIQEDYSMGYAQHLGFRASIATPFFWYNLKEETTTTLQIFPFQLMDVTFNSYLQISPKEVLNAVSSVINNTKKVNGHLISIWHNSSLSEAWEWKGWRKVYEEIIEQAL